MKILNLLRPGWHPFLIPITEEVPDDYVIPRNYRWTQPVFWLVHGPKGSHWCHSVGRRNAQTVYRHIPWDQAGVCRMAVGVPARSELANDAVFWKKEPGKPSEPWRLHNGKLELAPDGYSHIQSQRHDE
jgi:hypothetical protein